MKIILHAGIMKTGTTFLQNILKHNIGMLIKNRIYYQTLWANSKNDELNNRQFKENILNMYIDLAKIHRAKKLLLSEECQIYDIEFYNKFALQNKLNLEAIIYVRYFTSQIEKMVYQEMRNYLNYDNNITTKNVYKNRSKIIFSWLNKLNKCINAPHIVRRIYSYEKSCKEGLAKHFFEKLGLNVKEFNTEISVLERNISAHTHDTLFLNFIKILPLNEYEYKSFKDYFLTHKISSDTTDYLLFDKNFYYLFYKNNKELLNSMCRCLNYDQYINDSLYWLEGKKVCPHHEILEDQFNEIMNKLPNRLQNIIMKYVPCQCNIYNAIKKQNSKKYFLINFTTNKNVNIKEVLTYNQLQSISEQYPHDTSIYKEAKYFNCNLNHFQTHMSHIYYNNRSGCYTIKNWSRTYRKLLFLELSRVFNNKITISNFINNKLYSNEFLRVLLDRRIKYLHREYIIKNINRTKNMNILIFGAGEIFNYYYSLFTTQKILGILIDNENSLTEICGIKVYHPDNILPKINNIPIFIFSKEAAVIKKRLQLHYPQCKDIVTCCI